MRIIHSLPGRLRIEAPGLYRNPGLAILLEDDLALLEGVLETRANPGTGRILVKYLPGSVGQDRIEENISRKLAVFKNDPETLWLTLEEERQKEREADVFELESLSASRQIFFTVFSGALLVRACLMQRPRSGRPGSTDIFSALDPAITILTGYPIFRTALDHLLKKGRLSSELLAGIASVISLIVQESRLSLFVVWLVYLSTMARTLAVERAQRQIRHLLEGKKLIARLQTSHGFVMVPAGQVAPGAVVLVRKGERLPVDGLVWRGNGLVGQCLETGDLPPVQTGVGDAVYAGFILVDGELHVKADKVGDDTRISRVIRILEKHHNPYSYSRRTIDLMNNISLISLGATALTYLISGNLRRAVAMLTVGIPGAAGLALSLPLGMAAGRAAVAGILVKKGESIENMSRVDTVLFDKTTLLLSGNDYDFGVIAKLREEKIPHIGLLTGEPVEQVENVASRLQFQEYWTECKSWDKVEIIQRMQEQGRTVAVVGDRTSDFEALSAADAGITMSSAEDLPLESAQIIITGSDLNRVARLRRLARQSLGVARQNIFISAGANILGLLLGALNLLSPLVLVILPNASTMLILLNSGRLLLPFRPKEEFLIEDDNYKGVL